ncbi:MAG TPA: SusC/RagA family TonB-linked outer membrane protein [Longimicrobiales bacterium]|nr:SusC/RagA family TonB-linked outer membrane protein [Longimicrobiales bacterium]
MRRNLVRGTVRAILLVAASAFSYSALSAQAPRSYALTGTVTGAPGDQPLAGVQVSLRGTSFGTITDASGKYLLNANVAPGTYTVVFTFIGRSTETRQVTLGADQTVSVPAVSLRETAVELSQIVVTGTGAPTERRTVGNAISSVSGADVNGAPGAPSVDVALQGKVTGAVISENNGQPGGGVSIRLRGTSSILGGAEPLIVVDGVIVNNSSEAMVSLGANAGRGGAALTNRLADISPEDIDHIEVIKGAAAAALYGSKANNGVIQIFTKRGQQGAPRISVSSDLTIGQTPKQYALNMAPTAVYADVAFGLADSVGEAVQRYNYQDKLWRTAYGNNTHLSVSGGDAGTTYYVGGDYSTDQGIVNGSSNTKTSARVNLGQMLGDYLHVSANGNFIQSNSNFLPEGEQTQGVLTTLIFTPTTWNPAFDANLGRYPYDPILGGNPLDVIHNWKATDDVTRFIGSVQGTLRPGAGFTLRYTLGLDDYREENTYLQPPFSISASFTGRIDNPVRFSHQMNHDLTLTQDASLNDMLTLNSTAGLRYTDDRTEVIGSTAEDLPPGQQTVGGATLITSQSITELRTFGYYLQERLGVADRLFLTAGVNREASSAFGVDQRWQWFPRASVSYELGEAPFFKDSGLGNLVSTLRLRAAWGETGGQPPGAYDRFDNYNNVAYAGRPGLIASTLSGNPNLKPERQTETEGGFELGLWQDRAQLDFTYYNQATRDLVLSVPLPPSTGFQSQLQNIGELTNKGVEASLTTVNMARDNFTWRSRFQFSANRNKVTKLVTSADTLVFGYLNAVIEGQPVGEFYGGIWARNPDGSLQLNPSNGMPMRARDTISVGNTPYAYRTLGNPAPKWTASFSNDFDIGKAHLSLLLDGRFGNKVANFTRRITDYFGAGAALEQEASGKVPSRYYGLNPNGRISVYEEYVEDGSFVKLREISLSYPFDAPWVHKLGADRMTVRVAGRNLYTWTNYSGLDPEINLFSANTVARGVDFATTPIPRTFLVGVNFTF